MAGEISPALYRAGSGEPVVLLHGFTGSWRHWRPVLADLVARFEVIAPTLAGHEGGPELIGDGPLTLDHALDSLEQHLDELGIGTAHFVGNSMGGALSIGLAKRGRARSAVAFSPGLGWEPGSGENLRIAKFFARQARLLAMSQPRVPFVMASPRRRRLAYRDVMRRGELIPAPEAVAMARAAHRCRVVGDVLSELRRGPVFEGLGEIKAPVLLAWSEHDRILPVQTCSSRYRREIPGAEFRVLPGVGHVPMYDDSALVTATITEWVERHAAAAGEARAHAHAG